MMIQNLIEKIQMHHVEKNGQVMNDLTTERGTEDVRVLKKSIPVLEETVGEMIVGDGSVAHLTIVDAIGVIENEIDGGLETGIGTEIEIEEGATLIEESDGGKLEHMNLIFYL